MIKIDKDFLEAKTNGKILFSGILYVNDDLCIQLFYKTELFYIPIDPHQTWFYSAKSHIKYKAWKEFLKGECLL